MNKGKILGYRGLMDLLPTDILNGDIYVVKYAMSPYFNTRTVSGTGCFLRGFFTDPSDIIYSAEYLNM